VTEAMEDVSEALEEAEIETFHSSSSATPGVKTAIFTFYQWKYSHYFSEWRIRKVLRICVLNAGYVYRAASHCLAQGTLL